MKEDKIRFFKKFRIATSGCWLWSGYITPNGYGSFSCGKKKVYAHRFSFEIHKDKIPKKLVIDHVCKVRNCVNPDHLRVVTRAINTTENSDCPSAINKRKTHCVRGHKFTPENTINDGTARKCKKCTYNRHKLRTQNGYSRDYYKRNIIKLRDYARNWYRINKKREPALEGIIKKLK